MDIRIFISSTFWDFKREREILITEVWPELREYAWQYGAEVTFVDLRWGLTGEDASRNDIARLCLEEAGACRPLFLGLIGGRYGTVMPREAISLDRLSGDLQPSVEMWCAAGMSLTAMEVHHAVLDRPEAAPDAIFLLRDPALTEDWAREAGVDPVNWGAPTEPRQKALRDELRRVLPERTRDYASAEQFRAEASAYLMRLVHNRIGPMPELDGLQREARRQAARVARLLQHYQPDESFVEHVWTTLQAGRSVVLTGPPGRGCSAAAAWVAQQAEAAGWQVLGVCPEHEPEPFSAAASQLIRMALRALGRESESSNNDLLGLLGSLAARAPVLVVLDGCARTGVPTPLTDWFSSELLAVIRVLTTATEGTSLCYELQRRKLVPAPVPPLAPEARARLVELVLADARKRLTAAQVKRVWSCEAGANPAFLRTLLDELIAFGDLHGGTEDQDAFITKHALDPLLAAPDLERLCNLVLARVERVIGYDDTARFTTALGQALDGLQENELAQACTLNAAAVVRLRRAFSNHIVSAGDLLVPKRRAFADMALRRYKAVVADTHRRLTDWFYCQWRAGRNLPRVAQELPWLLHKAGRDDDLCDALADPRILVPNLHRSSGQLQHLWATVGSSELAKRAMTNLLNAQDQDEATWTQRAGDSLLLAACWSSAGLLDWAGQAYHGVWLQSCITGGRITRTQANTALDGFIAVICAEVAQVSTGAGLTMARHGEIVENFCRGYELVGDFRATGLELGGCAPAQVELRIAELERAKEEFIRFTEPNNPVPPIKQDPVLEALNRALALLNGRSDERADELAAQTAVMRLERLRTRFASGGDHGVGAGRELIAAVRSVRASFRVRPFWHPQRIYIDEVAHSAFCDVGHDEKDPAARHRFYAEASTVATAVLDAVERSETFVGKTRWTRLLNALETQAIAWQNGVALTQGELARARALLTEAPASMAEFAADVALKLYDSTEG